jgi:hypothetical protein
MKLGLVGQGLIARCEHFLHPSAQECQMLADQTDSGAVSKPVFG